jgi:cystathionine gamma-lyase
MRDATKIIRSTFDRSVPGEPLHFGPVLSFILRDKSASEIFLAKSKLLTRATSFGGVTTTAERQTRSAGDAVAEGFIRLSVGSEAIEDLAQALDAVR